MTVHDPKARNQRPGPRIWVTAAVLWLLLALGTAAALLNLRHAAIREQARELELLSLALGDAIERGLRGADEGIEALRVESRDGDLPLATEALERALRRRAELMPLVQSLWFVDTQGHLIAASHPLAMPAPESFEPPLATLRGKALAVSKAFVFVGDKTPMLALARRLPAGGWVLAALPAKELLGKFGSKLPTADTHIAIERGDGSLLAGVNLPLHPAAVRGPERPAGEGVVLQHRVDGSDELQGALELPGYGVRVLVSNELGLALKPWRETRDLAVLLLAALALATVVGVRLLMRANHRRREAQRALQVQKERSSRLESLGTMAGGVAHDFNNVLAGILGFTEMAQDEAEPGSEQAEYLDKVMAATLRGRTLAERILAFSRGGAKLSKVFELQPLVEEALTLVSASLREDIRLEPDLRAPGALLQGDPTLAFEAVLNLCTNAMQAMQDSSRIKTLSVQLRREQVLTPRVLSHSALQAGSQLVLSVTDEGPGITDEVLERLFEPFFTTRREQSGTGLGLAVVHGVVSEFGGAIDVQGRLGVGARFTLYLPESRQRPGPSTEADSTPARGAGQKLLVLDDEPALLQATTSLLNELGYAGTPFNDPAQALQALSRDPTQFAAVVTDEVMPGMTGTRLTAALRAQGIHLPVLLLSGYGGSLLAQRAAEAGVTTVLGKPAQRAEVARALAQMLA